MREKGTPKTGGRGKGIPNKVTATIRESISQFCSDNWKQIQNDFKQLEPKERIHLFERFLQYTIPRKTESKINLDFDMMTEEQITELAEQLINKSE